MPDNAQGAQERYDTWVCQYGDAGQKAHVGTQNGSRVRCSDPSTYYFGGGGVGLDNNGSYARAAVNNNFPYQVLGRTSRADYKLNQLNKDFNPQTRKLIVLMIAGLLLFAAVIAYK